MMDPQVSWIRESGCNPRDSWHDLALNTASSCSQAGENWSYWTFPPGHHKRWMQPQILTTSIKRIILPAHCCSLSQSHLLVILCVVLRRNVSGSWMSLLPASAVSYETSTFHCTYAPTGKWNWKLFSGTMPTASTVRRNKVLCRTFSKSRMKESNDKSLKSKWLILA